MALLHNAHQHKTPAHKIAPYVLAFVKAHVAKAQEVSKRTRVPVSVLLAQACEESDFGRHAPDNAYFGIKGKSSTGKSAKHATHEVVDGKSVGETDSFRAYKDFDEAADDYADFLISTPRLFAKAFAHVDDPIAFAQEMGRSGYATNPKYGPNLVSIIKSNNLLQYEVNPMKGMTTPTPRAKK